jgi:hypothetical protein
VASGEVEPLRERIRQLLRDPGLRVRLGNRGRTVYEEHFALDQTVSKTLAVYRDVLRQGLDDHPERAVDPASPDRGMTRSGRSG